ncbi:TetR/AcrR family transcriptional regulator [Actinomadura sp. HBU206391]|uniref:TetR/AcrR family transcriptional regulator n=1 Tax=Actinomadura sp. HBU206391 TaxID=2731692 RepID=UPI00164FB42F|nr:TetR/AcrR family transcriptional regulator [Actinomadura sp. HBU206391]MBC6461839.1 TetR/AcrR family transcriptional regulator [Actinomadura sp. HBU206391]
MADTSGRTAGASPRADARRNRDRVLEAARAAFAAEGLPVPLDEIARRAGVGAGTVYRHFSSKEALYEAVLQDGLEQLACDARDLTAADDPGEAFFALFSRTIERASFNRALCEALAAGPGIRPEEASDASEVKDRFQEALGVLLARAQNAGAVRSDVDAVDVRKLIAGCVTMEQHGGPPGRATAVVRDGLRPAGSGERPLLPTVTKVDGAGLGRNEIKAPLVRETPAGADEGEGAGCCEVCGAPIEAARTGRRARFCGGACRQKAHRRRAQAQS